MNGQQFREWARPNVPPVPAFGAPYSPAHGEGERAMSTPMESASVWSTHSGAADASAAARPSLATPLPPSPARSAPTFSTFNPAAATAYSRSAASPAPTASPGGGMVSGMRPPRAEPRR